VSENVEVEVVVPVGEPGCVEKAEKPDEPFDSGLLKENEEATFAIVEGPICELKALKPVAAGDKLVCCCCCCCC